MSDPSRGILAERLLEVMRQQLRLSVGVVGLTRPCGEFVYRVDASDTTGQSWRAEHPDYYRAVLLLAELVGFQLDDG